MIKVMRTDWLPCNWAAPTGASQKGRDSLRSGEAVDLQDSDLEVAAGAERRVVERRAAVRLAEPYVLVHPYRLPVAVNETHFLLSNKPEEVFQTV